MKICRHCKEYKIDSEFGLNNSTIDKKNTICKECNKLKRKMYFRTKKGVITDMYSNQIKSSKERGINPPNYTKKEFYDWVMNQSHFQKLFNNWVLSNYEKYKKPSCDRIDSNNHYTLNNLQLITWLDNLNKVKYEVGNTVYVYDEYWKLSHLFHSTKDCLEEFDTIKNHIDLSRISKELELHMGYYFQEYKNDKRRS